MSKPTDKDIKKWNKLLDSALNEWKKSNKTLKKLEESLDGKGAAPSDKELAKMQKKLGDLAKKIEQIPEYARPYTKYTTVQLYIHNN